MMTQRTPVADALGVSPVANAPGSPRRGGFTLLELILALAIGLVLMSALYVTMATQLSSAQAGRDSIQEATVARSILARISSDINASLGAYDPRMQSGSSSSSSLASSATAAPAGDAIKFNVGVQGDGQTLVLVVGRVPREILGVDKLQLDPNVLPKVCDLRRISYWAAEGQGLLVQELTGVTSTDIDTTPPDVDGAKKLAPEVKSITFQYWDGTQWTASWDSTSVGADGETQVGPPAGIEIVLEMTPKTEGQEPRKYRHVVNLPTGNNYSTQATQ